MSKSSKTYRLERDTAIALLEQPSKEVFDLIAKSGEIQEQLDNLEQQSQEAINSAVFKTIDPLMKQNRLIMASLKGNEFTLRFKLNKGEIE